MSIKNNIAHFQQEIMKRGARLVAVSKTQPLEKIKEAYDAGQRIFGENKVQEITVKQPLLPPDIEWHLIGHLQTNKVKYIAPFVAMIHSVDSQKLLEEINKQGKKVDRIISCLLQVHIAEEETKFGFDAAEVMALVTGPFLQHCPFIRVDGLMGMATLTEDVSKIHNEFKQLKSLFETIQSKKIPHAQMKELSMGMSADYQIALEEGTTLVRIGTAIFGERDYTKP